MARKIVHLATTHRVDDARIFQKECQTLARAGYEVVYVVPSERDEVIHGVQVRAVPRPTNGKERMTQTVWHVYRRALEEGEHTICHLHDADLLPIGFMLKLQGRTVVYDAHEDTPRQMLHQHWIPRPLRRFVGLAYAGAERLAGYVFDAIVAAVPAIAQRYPPEKTILVRNFPLLEEQAERASVPYSERPAIVTYLGGITRARGAEEMVRAVGLLPPALSAELHLAGSFHPADLVDELAALPGAARMRLLGWIDRSGVADLLASSRVGLVLLHPTPQYTIAYPVKLFEYMAAGIPVVASDIPLWRGIIEKAGCGLTVNPFDVEAIAETVRWLLEHPVQAGEMGQRGREAVFRHYNWASEGERLVELYTHRLA